MRDRDVRTAIHDALLATGAFDGVWIWGLPEDYGTGSSQLAAAAIEPESSTQEDRWDSAPGGGLLITSRVTLTFLKRDDDPQLRDEAVEGLFNSAANVLNGQSLAGLTLPQLTRFLACAGRNPWLPNAESRARSPIPIWSKAGAHTTTVHSQMKGKNHGCHQSPNELGKRVLWVDGDHPCDERLVHSRG